MSADPSTLRWGVERRLEFIEFRLYWEGGVNRSDLIQAFGVSVPQASKDFSQYQELAPENMVYDRTLKRYRATQCFAPILFRPSADSLLAELSAAADPARPGQPAWLSAPPHLDMTPLPRRRIDPEVLRRLLHTVREGRSARILYQSMNAESAEPRWRDVSPHAFGHDGQRWHVRAFNHADRMFKDFVISRMTACEPGAPATAGAADDADWNAHVMVMFEPNPGLTPAQREIIAADYLMENGAFSVSVRRSFLHYLKDRPRRDRPDSYALAMQTPIVVANPEIFEG